MTSHPSLAPATVPTRPCIARPALREAARLAAKRLADLRRRAAPAPAYRIVWEISDE